jgi:hypothetical protein
MNSQSFQPQRRVSWVRQIAGSFISALAGWAVLNLYFVAWGFFFQDPGSSFPWWWLLGPIAIHSAVFIFSTWFLALLPLCLFVPSHLILRRWAVFTLSGMLVGGVEMFCYCLIHADVPGVYVILSALTGGLSALLAALTANYFRYDRNG